MVFEDNISRCEGDVLFETVGAYSAHDAFVRDLETRREKQFSGGGLTHTTKRSQVPLHGVQARNIVYSLEQGDDGAKHSVLDVHLPWRHLSIVSEISCMDPALLESQLEAVLAFLHTAREGGELIGKEGAAAAKDSIPSATEAEGAEVTPDSSQEPKAPVDRESQSTKPSAEESNQGAPRAAVITTSSAPQV